MYYSAYNIPEYDDKGIQSATEFFQVNCLGYYELENLGAVRHRKKGRTDYLLIYNYVGKATARSHGADHEIGDGTVIIYHPGEEQFYKLHEDRPVKSFWIHFTGYGVETILKKLNLEDKNIYTIGHNDEIPTLIRMAKSEIQDRRAGFELCAASLIIQLLTAVSRRYLNSRFSKKILESNSKLDFSINYLHSNYSKDIKVSELADLAGLSVSRYISVFRKITGTTPRDYLIKYRLEKAKELIRDTNLTIRQISMIIGFEDQLYFSRVFRKYEGVCPSKMKLSF